MGRRREATGSAPSVCLVALLSGAAILSPTSADAYLDPVSGSYVIQILLAMLVSIGVAVRHYWTRLTSLWSRLTSGRATGEQAPKGPSSDPD